MKVKTEINIFKNLRLKILRYYKTDYQKYEPAELENNR